MRDDRLYSGASSRYFGKNNIVQPFKSPPPSVLYYPPFSPPLLMVSCLCTFWNISRFFLSSASPSFKVYRSARAMATTSLQQPPWIPPKSSSSLPPLKIRNSLTRSKTVCLFPFFISGSGTGSIIGIKC